jgi:hypothetical protein
MPARHVPVILQLRMPSWLRRLLVTGSLGLACSGAQSASTSAVYGGSACSSTGRWIRRRSTCTPFWLAASSERSSSSRRHYWRGHVIATTGSYIGDAPPYQGHVALFAASNGKAVEGLELVLLEPTSPDLAEQPRMVDVESFVSPLGIGRVTSPRADRAAHQRDRGWIGSFRLSSRRSPATCG